MTELSKEYQDYFKEKNINSLDGLAKHIEELKRNTFTKTIIGELIHLLENNKLDLLDFFAGNKVKDLKPLFNAAAEKRYNDTKELRKYILNYKILTVPVIFEILEAETKQQLIEILVRLKMEEGEDLPQAKISSHFLDEILEQTQTMQDKAQEQKSKVHIENHTVTKLPEDSKPNLTEVDGWKQEDYRYSFLNFQGDKKEFPKINTDWMNTKTFEKSQDKYGESYIGKKESAGKTDYSEINWNFIDAMAKRMNANKHKYPHGNSQKHIDIDDLLQATQRHLRRMLQPIPGDTETFEEHGAAVGCNMAMIFTQLENGQKLSLDLDVKM